MINNPLEEQYVSSDADFVKESAFQVSFGVDNGLNGPVTILKADCIPNENGEIIILAEEGTQIRIVSDVPMIECRDLSSVSEGNDAPYQYLFADNVKIMGRYPLNIVENDN